MIFESTDGQEEMYLAFHVDGLAYVLPLSDVGQIVAKTPEDMPEISLAGPKGRDDCAVIFQDDEGLATLAVGKVEGIVQLPPDCQYELPALARSPGNVWIAGVAYMENTGSLCYLIDCRKLRDCFLGGLS